VKKIIAVLLSLLLVHCEWHDSFAQLFKTGNDCSTSCCAKQCSDSAKSKKSCDDKGKSSDPVKNCCTSCCCYLPAAPGKIAVFAIHTEIVFPPHFFFADFFSADCFHPPEII
jgi:hypothetical protein